MKRLVTILTIALSLFAVSETHAQNKQVTNYGQAVGVRVGLAPGVTYRKFLSDKNAFEVIGSARVYTFGQSYFGVTGLYQWVLPFPVEQMNWYFGVGADLGIYSDNSGSAVSVGVDGIIGADYTLADYPFTFSVDFIPSFALINGGFYGGNVGLSARYIF